MLPAEVCRVAGHPVEVRCLSSEVCRADCAAESHRVAGHPAESRRADCCGGAPSHWPRYAVTPCHWSSCGGARLAAEMYRSVDHSVEVPVSLTVLWGCPIPLTTLWRRIISLVIV